MNWVAGWIEKPHKLRNFSIEFVASQISYSIVLKGELLGIELLREIDFDLKYSVYKRIKHIFIVDKII